MSVVECDLLCVSNNAIKEKLIGVARLKFIVGPRGHVKVVLCVESVHNRGFERRKNVVIRR
jgi:hypothetical protein